MSSEKRDPTENRSEFEAYVAELMAKFLASLNRIATAECSSVPLPGRGDAFRRGVLAGVRQLVTASHNEMALSASHDPNKTFSQKVEMNQFSIISHLMSVAVIEMAANRNTQWDDPDLLMGQLTNQIHVLIRGLTAIDAETGTHLTPKEALHG